jgi:hypothetical protein
MSCREYEADIVDLARGAGVSVEAEARLRGHLDACAGCAARLVREQHMTAALRDVADSAPQPSRSDAIEAQLLRAFAARHAAGTREAASRRPPRSARTAWGWLAAAAVLVLAVVVWRGSARWPSPAGAGQGSAEVAAAPAVSLAAAPPAAETAPRRDEVLAPVLPRDGSPQAAPGRAGAAGRRAMPAAPTADDGILRFVSLPTAIGLPEFESGRIVRVELATAMLPAYGFDVVPGSESGVVEADVLVGQDDQPRAIRFVNLKTDSRRRQ